MDFAKDFNDFHDWYIDGILIKSPCLDLYLHFSATKKLLRFVGVSRCFMTGFIIQNVIHDFQTLEQGKSPEYAEKLALLNKSYPWGPNEAKTIGVVNPSVGADLVVEFTQVCLQDMHE